MCHMSALATWRQGTHTADGVTHPTYRKGDGPGVIVIHELPGMTPKVITFAEEVVAAGHTVVMPHLFGEPGAPMSVGGFLKVVPRVCVSREFTSWPGTRPRRSRGGCDHWPGSCTRTSAAPAWEP